MDVIIQKITPGCHGSFSLGEIDSAAQKGYQQKIHTQEGRTISWIRRLQHPNKTAEKSPASSLPAS